MSQVAEHVDRHETPAEVYDRLFIPALAAQWAARVADAARLAPGERVLDVACGTGAMTQEALTRVAPDGDVIGLDASPDMLAVARRKLPDTDLREGHAEQLPFDDSAFDAVTCNFGLMFFEDRERALQEMQRVVRPGGRIALVVWDRLDRTPGYAALTGLIERYLGEEAGKPVRGAFGLGDVDLVRSMLERAGGSSVEVNSVDASACFPSIDDWVEAEVRGWVGEGFSESDYQTLLAEAHQVLAPYLQSDGTVEFALPAVVATAWI